jgi:hypothetical protein
MSFVLQPWLLFFLILASWVNREQQQVIEYLRTENQVLKEKLGKKRILLSDDHRRRLAVKGKMLGRKMLQEYGTLFTPDTILRWHRTLVARKWDYSDRKDKTLGRPRIRQVIVDLILNGTTKSSNLVKKSGTRMVRSNVVTGSVDCSDTTIETLHSDFDKLRVLPSAVAARAGREIPALRHQIHPRCGLFGRILRPEVQL